MFQGSCHCKKVRFQIETKNIYEDIYKLAPNHYIEYDCSLSKLDIHKINQINNGNLNKDLSFNNAKEKTYELISQKGNEPKLFHKLLPYWNDAMQLYQEQKWDMAITLFNKCNNFEEDYIGRLTTPSKIYILRCEKFKLDSPALHNSDPLLESLKKRIENGPNTFLKALSKQKKLIR